MSKEVHVVASKGAWAVRCEGKIISVHQTEGVAVERARKVARRADARVVVVHGRDGKVRWRASPGAYPGRAAEKRYA